MRVLQVHGQGLDDPALTALAEMRPDLVLVFAAAQLLAQEGAHARLLELAAGAVLAGCSSGGEISGAGVGDGGVVLTGIAFEHTPLRVAQTRLETMEHSFQAGAELGLALADDSLATVIMFAKGMMVNGSDLVRGLEQGLGRAVPFSGGLAGDGGSFRQTLTVTPSGIGADEVVAVGLYGGNVRLGHGSFGGWQPFGPLRRVSRARGNVLYELDGQPALSLYREYLGEFADDLPSSSLQFPFEMVDSERRSSGLIRTVLGVDVEAQALILAGDVDSNGYLRLMHADRDGLVDGAETAACRALAGLAGRPPQLALLVSCVGRKAVMADRVDDEIEAVGAILGRRAPMTGFYANGEVAPDDSGEGAQLHNQTMTITLLAEA